MKVFFYLPVYIQKNLIRQFVNDIIVDPESGIINCNFRKVPWINDVLSRNNIIGFEKVESTLTKKKRLENLLNFFNLL